MTVRQLIKHLIAFPNPNAEILIFAKDTFISEHIGKIKDKRDFLVLVTKERLKKNETPRLSKKEKTNQSLKAFLFPLRYSRSSTLAKEQENIKAVREERLKKNESVRQNPTKDKDQNEHNNS